MMGERTGMQEALFYEFSLEQHVPERHMMRLIDRFVDLAAVRRHLQPFYSDTGRPSIDPEFLIRMLIVGYCMGIRSERRLCEEVHLNLAYRWFCRLGLDSAVPDHSTFSKNRHSRFRESDLLRQVFETTVRRCIAERLVGGDSFGVDASLSLDPSPCRRRPRRRPRICRPLLLALRTATTEAHGPWSSIRRVTGRAPAPSAPFCAEGGTLGLDVSAVDRRALRHRASRHQRLQQLQPKTPARRTVEPIVDRRRRPILGQAIAPAAAHLQHVQDA